MTIESKNRDELVELLLHEFNWRWKAHLKNQYTPQQFSTGFRKFLKGLKEPIIAPLSSQKFGTSSKNEEVKED